MDAEGSSIDSAGVASTVGPLWNDIAGGPVTVERGDEVDHQFRH
jgi:hypothetical protein